MEAVYLSIYLVLSYSKYPKYLLTYHMSVCGVLPQILTKVGYHLTPIRTVAPHKPRYQAMVTGFSLGQFTLSTDTNLTLVSLIFELSSHPSLFRTLISHNVIGSLSPARPYLYRANQHTRVVRSLGRTRNNKYRASILLPGSYSPRHHV